MLGSFTVLVKVVLVQDKEDDGQERSSEQISQSREVRDGRVVRINAALPKLVNKDTGNMQQQSDLNWNVMFHSVMIFNFS